MRWVCSASYGSHAWRSRHLVLQTWHDVWDVTACLASVTRAVIQGHQKQNGRHFADDIFSCVFLKENLYTLIPISLKFVPMIDKKSTLVQVTESTLWKRWQAIAWTKQCDDAYMCHQVHMCSLNEAWVTWAYSQYKNAVLLEWGIPLWRFIIIKMPSY